MKPRTCHRRAFLATGAAAVSTAVSLGTEPARTDAPTIDCDFPGGNILVDRIDGDQVHLHQDPRDTPGFWFYWCFRVRGAAGRTLTFHFTAGNVLAARGPAISTDDGKTWQWLGKDSVDGASFSYTFPPHAGATRFCLAVPYQQSHFEAFLKRHADCPHLKVGPHCTTKKGRRTQRLRFGKLDGEPAHRVLLTARNHSCEMMAGYALEGLVEGVLSDTPEGRWLREQVEFAAVGMMDQDGVEDGDQGKNRRPHDHNRDFLGESIYPSVAALKEFVPGWSAGKLRIALDMHCPWIRGGSNEEVFFVGHPAEAMWEQQQQFSRTLQQVQTGPLRHDPRHNVPWGTSWNTMKEPKSCARWAAEQPGIKLAVTIEIPYATAGGKPVTAASARLLGHDLARAMCRYLRAG